MKIVDTILQHIESSAQYLCHFTEELRTEVIAGILLDLGFTEQDILISRNSSFYKPKIPDLLKVSTQKDKPCRPVLELQLSRDSIYDLLPQAVFHEYSSYSGEEISSVKIAIAQYKLRLSEERVARQFFMPLENEFFFQQVHIEQNEKKWIANVEVLKDLMGEGWKLELPKNFMVKFTSLLPYVHLFPLNSSTTEVFLKWIFDESISISQKCVCKPISIKENSLKGFPSLGIDMILGLSYWSDMPQWEVCINLSNPAYFVPGGAYRRVLDVCFKYLFPFEVDIEMVFKISDTGFNNCIGQENCSSFIGYNFRL